MARDAGGDPDGLGVMGTEGRERRGEGMVARRMEEDKAVTLIDSSGFSAERWRSIPQQSLSRNILSLT